MNISLFAQVDYRQFRSVMRELSAPRIKEQRFKTVIQDRQGNIRAFIQAAGIDPQGRCHHTAYFVRKDNSSAAIAA